MSKATKLIIPWWVFKPIAFIAFVLGVSYMAADSINKIAELHREVGRIEGKKSCQDTITEDKDHE